MASMTEPDAREAADTPLLIELPPPGPRSAVAAPAAPAPDFIAFPPGLPLPTSVADSATHRLAEMRRQTDAPAPPAAPTRVPLVGRATAASLVFTQAPTARTPLPTPAASPVAPAVWTLRFGGSTEPVVVDSALFVGRNPVATPAQPEAALRAVIDPAKSVSKTHAMFWAEGAKLHIQDLDSTNGVSVADADGTETLLESGATLVVASGSTIYLGDFAVLATHDQPAQTAK